MPPPNSTRGRFAPSPTGPLHLGSLVAAVGSYLDAKSAGGEWLVRMEDLDAPRIVPGAADVILRSLEAHCLHWDGPVLFQSARTDAYRAALESLGDAVYPCGCSRKDIALQGEGRYPGTCRGGMAEGRCARAYRLRVPPAEAPPVEFTDRLRGVIRESLHETCGDFALLRADGIFAYQLAVVVDDAAQGITDVVRGADLLDSTARQVYLCGMLGLGPAPRYLHVPVVCDSASNEKLSKQTHAAALEDGRAGESLRSALKFLGQSPPVELGGAGPRELLDWGIWHWDPANAGT